MKESNINLVKDIVKKCIHHYISNRNHIDISTFEINDFLENKTGIITYIKQGGEIRGEAAHITADRELFLNLKDLSVKAWLDSKKFYKTDLDVNQAVVEINLINNLRAVKKIEKEEMLDKNVMIKYLNKSEFILSDDIAKKGFDKMQTLYYLCEKGKINKNYIKESNVLIFTFDVEKIQVEL